VNAGIVACLLAACLLAGCAPAPTAPAPPTTPASRMVDRSAFVSAVRAGGVQQGDDPTLIRTGLVVCDELRAGTPPSVLSARQEAEGWTFTDATVITYAAITHICPDVKVPA